MTEKKTTEKKTPKKKEPPKPSPEKLLREKRAERQGLLQGFEERLTKLHNKRADELQKNTAHHGGVVKGLRDDRLTKQQAEKDRFNTAVAQASKELEEAVGVARQAFDAKKAAAQTVYDAAVQKITEEHHELMKVPWEDNKAALEKIEGEHTAAVEKLMTEQDVVMGDIDEEVAELERQVLAKQERKEKAEAKAPKEKAEPAPQGECLA